MADDRTSHKKLPWDDDAATMLARVPFFVRGFTRKQVEQLVRSEGRDLVTMADVRSARDAFLQKTSGTPDTKEETETTLYSVEKCRGSGAHCPFAMGALEDLSARVKQVVAESGWYASMRSRIDGPLLHHHRLNVALAECPNACTHPQIKDIGVIATEWPTAVTDACNACGRCEEACSEDAIAVRDESAVLDADRCIGCGLCVRHCPAHAIESGGLRFRLLVGGRLGRHPRLAVEVGREFTADEVVEAVRRIVRLVVDAASGEERFAAVVARLGDDAIARCVRGD